MEKALIVSVVTCLAIVGITKACHVKAAENFAEQRVAAEALLEPTAEPTPEPVFSITSGGKVWRVRGDDGWGFGNQAGELKFTAEDGREIYTCCDYIVEREK